MTNPEVYENNVTTANTYYNKVELYQGAIKLGSDDGKVSQKNTIFDKKDPTYNYETHTLHWELEVDKDEMALSGVEVSDTIAEGLALLQATIKVDGTQIDKGNTGATPYYTYDDDTRELVVVLGDIAESTGMRRITFDTLIDVENAVFINGGVRKPLKTYNGDITILNSASLKKTSSINQVADTGSITIRNKILDKTGAVEASVSGRVNYEVVINQTGVELPGTCMVTDVLSPGLTLNLPSLKLYKATVADNGAMTAGSQVAVNYNTAVLTGGSTRLELKLPQNSATQSYVLKYNADVTDTTKASYSNVITMTGLNPASEGTQVSMSNAQILGGGGGSGGSSSRVEITKKDRQTGVVLAGAVFALSYDGHEIDRKATGGSGTTSFTNLEVGETYTVTEITPPMGYALAETTAQTFVAPAKGYANRQLITFENEKKQAALSFRKVSDKGNPLAGATFGLYLVETSSGTEVLTKRAEAISQADGTVQFSRVGEGTYRIQELLSPAGYVVSTEEIVAVVDENAIVTEFYQKGDSAKTLVTVFENKAVDADNITPPSQDNANDPGADIPQDGTGDGTMGEAGGGTTGGTEGTPAGDTIGEGVEGGSAQPPTDAPETGTANMLQSLPQTGREPRMIFYVIGAGFILVGVGMIWSERRRRQREKR